MLTGTNTLEQNFDIPADKADDARKAVARANNRLAKANLLQEQFALKFDFYEVIKKNAAGHDVAVKRAKVTLNRPYICYDGYTFMARIEEVTPGKFVAFSAPNVELNGWRPGSMMCEHCNKSRARTKVYVVKDKTDHYKVVGGNCIALYTGLSPSMLWSLDWDPIKDYSNPDWEDDPKTPTVRVYSTDEVLTLAYTLTKRYGYNSVSSSNSTRDLVTDLIDGVGHIEDREEILEAAAGCKAADIRKLIKSQLDTNVGDWATNIMTVIDNEYVEARHLGLLASAPTVAVKAEQKAAFDNQFTNNWFEPVGAKVTGYEMTLIDQKDRYESYGWQTNRVSYLTFRDSFGHKVFWKTSTNSIPPEGVKVLMDFTVKSHDDYKGVKSTRITRGRWMLAPT